MSNHVEPLAALLNQPHQEVDFSEWLTTELRILHDQLLKLGEFTTKWLEYKQLWAGANARLEDMQTFRQANAKHAELETLGKSMLLVTCGENDGTLQYFIDFFELTAKHIAFLLAVREANIPIPPIRATLEKLTLNKTVAWYVLTIRQKVQSSRV